MRKLFLFISFVALTISFSSCLNVSEPQFSPSIHGSYFYVNPVFRGDSLISAQDSITELFYDADDGTYDLDTVYVGDTVMFAARFYTYTSDLVSVKLDWEKNHLDLWYFLNDSIKSALTETSDTTAGKLAFDLGYNSVAFPIYFTPLLKGGTTIKLTVTSTSEYSTSSVKFYIPAQVHAADSIATN